MYAIIKTGGKQYRVKEGDIIAVELLSGEAKETAEFEPLLLNTGNAVKVGTPTVAGVSVKCEILAEVKDDKKIIYKYKRRKNCRVKNGHRQKLSRVKITEISGG